MDDKKKQEITQRIKRRVAHDRRTIKRETSSAITVRNVLGGQGYRVWGPWILASVRVLRKSKTGHLRLTFEFYRSRKPRFWATAPLSYRLWLLRVLVFGKRL